MQKSGSKRKSDFSVFITTLMQRYEESPQQYLQINTLSTETGVEKRRLYDLMNVLVACGICSKTNTHTYRWEGRASFHSAFVQIMKETEIRSIRYPLDTLFLLPESPPIGTVTSYFLGIFGFLGMNTIGIRDAAVLMAPDDEKSKQVLRRLYLVAYLLEHTVLTKHSQNMGEYTIAEDLPSLTTSVIEEIVSEGEYGPDRIENKLNRIDANFVRNLYEHRRREFAKLLRLKSITPDGPQSALDLPPIHEIDI